jgi:hypothetical protein
MFRPFSGWAIISLRLEYRRKLLYYNVDIKHRERDLILQCLGRCVAIYMQCGLCDVCDFIVSSVSSSTHGLESFLSVALAFTMYPGATLLLCFIFVINQDFIVFQTRYQCYNAVISLDKTPWDIKTNQ